MSERWISMMLEGGFTALIDRPTSSRSSVGWSASRPGTSIVACPTISFARLNLSTRFAPMSDTYQCDPSGSTTT